MFLQIFVIGKLGTTLSMSPVEENLTFLVPTPSQFIGTQPFLLAQCGKC
jgi:hypothetical protein